MSAPWGPIVFHVDMDAFYAAIEQRDRPTLRGQPVIVGGLGARGVVSTASYEARAYGVHSALPMYLARQRCPQGVFLTPRGAYYAEVSRQVMAIFGRYSPTVEPLSLDEAFLDMTGTEALMGPPEKTAARLQREIKAELDLDASIGVASVKYIAKVASDLHKPRGLTVCPPGEERAFLAPLPIERLWGVGKKTAVRVRALGLSTIGDVAGADPRWLESELKSLGRHIHNLAHGRDARMVERGVERKSIGAERTLAQDVTGKSAVLDLLRPLADSVAAALRKKERLAGGVRLKVKYADFQLRTRDEKLLAPVDNADAILEVLARLCDRTDLATPMRLVGLAAYDLVERQAPQQGSLFAPAPVPQKRGALDAVLDQVTEKFGKGAVRRASHEVHERFCDLQHGADRPDDPS